jgi:glutaredoxin-related protein
MNCPHCGSEKTYIQKHKIYSDGTKGIGYQCVECKKYFTVKDSDQQLQTMHENHKKIGISLDELIKTHDVDELIKEGLKQLKKGTLYTESEFVDIAGLRGKQYRSSLDSPDMKPYRGKIDSIIYMGVPEDIETLRQRFIMR